MRAGPGDPEKPFHRRGGGACHHENDAMTALLAILAVLSGSAAAWLCYLASPQQQYAATCRHCPEERLVDRCARHLMIGRRRDGSSPPPPPAALVPFIRPLQGAEPRILGKEYGACSVPASAVDMSDYNDLRTLHRMGVRLGATWLFVGSHQANNRVFGQQSLPSSRC